jgi:hypothetical protein
MNTNRSPPKYKHRPTLYLGMTALSWSGTLVVAVVIVSALYCLLTHQIPA